MKIYPIQCHFNQNLHELLHMHCHQFMLHCYLFLALQPKAHCSLVHLQAQALPSFSMPIFTKKIYKISQNTIMAPTINCIFVCRQHVTNVRHTMSQPSQWYQKIELSS